MFVYKSESTVKLTEALIKFQKAVLENKLKPEESGNRGNKYAKLEQLYEYCLKKLNNVGLSLDQSDTHHDGSVWVRTTITHISDEFKSSYDYLYPCNFLMENCGTPQETGNAQQAKGCIKTYVCRYALKNMLCLPIDDEDFDSVQSTEKKKPFEPFALKGCITLDEVNALMNTLKGKPEVKKLLLENFNVKFINQIPAGKYKDAVSFIVREFSQNSKDPESYKG